MVMDGLVFMNYLLRATTEQTVRLFEAKIKSDIDQFYFEKNNRTLRA